MVVAVERIEKRAVLADKCSLCSRRTGIDAEIAVSFVGGKIGSYNVVDTLTCQKRIVFLLVFKQRFETGNFEINSDLFLKTFFQRKKRNFGLSVCIHRGTDGCKQVRVVRCDGVFPVEL